jgi:DUF1680 family protein
MERVRTNVIPYQWKALNDEVPRAEPSYAIRNFKLAAELTHPELDYGVPKDTGFGGFVFQDSDLANGKICLQPTFRPGGMKATYYPK